MKKNPRSLRELANAAPVGENDALMSANRVPLLALLALTLAPAAVGMTEEIPMGLLPEISQGLHVSLSAVGMLVSGYALGVMIGAPLLAVCTIRVPRKPLLLGAIALYLIGNLLNAVVPTYNMLLVVRFLTALAHGIIFGESYVFAAQLLPQKPARALAFVFGGFTVATVLFVPAGTWLGQTFGWRTPFLAITGLGVCSWLAVAFLVPSIARKPQVLSLREQLRLLAKLRVLLPGFITVTSLGGIFALLTYITPLLEQISGFAPAAISALLLLFGLGSLGGNLAGGRLTEWRLFPSLLGLQLLQVVALLLFSLWGGNPVLAVIVLCLWESAGFATIAPVQSVVIEQAGDASSLASTFNVAAANLGNGAAAFLSGLMLSSQFGLRAVPVVAILFIATGLGLTFWNARL
jgi:DHA1 family inner membrane transport protein